MKYNNKIKLATKTVVCLGVLSFGSISCTDNFENMNTPPYGMWPDEINVESQMIRPQLEVYSTNGNMYQYQKNLHIDLFSGYFCTPHNFGGNHNGNYKLRGDFNHGPFEGFFIKILPSTRKMIKNSQDLGFEEYAAVMKIVQVMGGHEVVDVYGPMPYRSAKVEADVLSYDAPEQVYDNMLVELDEAITALTSFLDSNPSEERLAGLGRFDMWCGGDYKLWIKMANTLKMRMGMRLVKVDAHRSQSIVESAYNHKYSVLESSDPDIEIKNTWHPMHTMDISWGDSRIGASLESLLKGYADPRLPVYMKKNGGPIKNKAGEVVMPAGSGYYGIRNGLIINEKSDDLYLPFSSMNVEGTTPVVIMRVAEAYFLRAEAALRGWNVGADTKTLYEEGIRTSLQHCGIIDVSIQNKYLNGQGGLEDIQPSATGFAADYVDPHDPENNIEARNRITVKWDDASTNEEKLQRIITQKYLAIFPASQEAWSEFRRTGYPKLFPIKVNLSAGVIDSEIQIRRLPLNDKEKNTNTVEVEKAQSMLNGPDTGATRLWWDKEGGNF